MGMRGCVKYCPWECSWGMGIDVRRIEDTLEDGEWHVSVAHVSEKI